MDSWICSTGSIRISTSVFKIRSETCRTEAQFCQNLYMVKRESVLDRTKFCQLGSVVRLLFWRLQPAFRCEDRFPKWHFSYQRCIAVPDAIMNTTETVILQMCTCQAPVPLTVFWLNSKFDKNLERCSLKHAQSITMKFCICLDSHNVVMCAKLFVVIGILGIQPEHFKYWSNFKFNRNIVSGTGAR